MKAVACLAPGQLSLIDRPEPALPGPGEALVAVAHVGICGTDYHIFEGKHPYLAYPRVMGHEVSGTVVAVGVGVAVSPGTEVIVNPYIACGICIACRQGKPNCCVTISVLGVHRDGAMCGHILVPAANLYPTDGLPLRLAAAVEFLAIGAHAVRRSLAGPGRLPLVIGAGPIGLGSSNFRADCRSECGADRYQPGAAGNGPRAWVRSCGARKDIGRRVRRGLRCHRKCRFDAGSFWTGRSWRGIGAGVGCHR